MSIVDAIGQDVTQYAARVRVALADLDQDQVDDLTDGLEANLADALADDGRVHRGSLVDEFGEPEAYAAELRAAAGLAPAARAANPEGVFRAALLAPWRSARRTARTALAGLRTTRWFPGVEEALLELRPAWWVLRGWALAHLLLDLLGAEPYAFWVPSTFGGWVLMALAVVASVQWGRGRWRTGPRWGRVLRFANGVLALTAVVLLLSLPSAHRNDVARAQYLSEFSVTRNGDGVVVDGEQAHNLFVYDAEGEPVEGAQIFDQEGRPVTTEPHGGDRWAQQEYWPDGAADPLLHVGVPGVNGQTRWNVFPLHSVPGGAWSDDGTLDVTDDDVREQVLAPSWPFAAAAPVVPWTARAESGAAPTPTPSATPGSSGGEAPGDPAPTEPAAGAPAAPDGVASQAVAPAPDAAVAPAGP